MEISFRVNGREIASFPSFVSRAGHSYLMRFKSMEYDTHRATIFPIYQQLFDAVPKPGEFTFSIYFGDSVIDFIFFKRAPFFNLGISKSRIETGEDDE